MEAQQIEVIMQATQELADDLETFLRRYYAEDIAELANHYPRDQQSLYIDWTDLYQYDPDLADDAIDHPHTIQDALEDALRVYDLPVDISLANANVRLQNLEDTEVLDVAEVSRRDNIGSLLGITAQVSKVSDPQPRLVTAVYVCQRCGAETEVPQSGEDVQEPYQCEACERQGPFRLDADRSEFVDYQAARLQQPPERTHGGNAAEVDVQLEDDIIHEFDAGDRVELTGILDVEEASSGDSRAFDTTIQAQSVVREESDYEDLDIDAHLDRIQEIASGDSGDSYELLVDSINPQHKGDRDVKLAIALQLFGGWSRGGRKRGDSHVLLMGDPGCGKSTFLQAVDDLAPRSTYASGKGATAAGLTAAAVADDFGDSEYSLEAGALVLADRGVACIDEIDKVPDTAVSSLHDALESQLVRVNKASIEATLRARTALLAAGNPEEGRFDSYRAKAQQLDLGPTLLSRFDLMFMVSDSPDPETDEEIVDHMIRSRRAAAKKELGEDLTDEERASVEPAIPHDVLRAYIAHAKQSCKPILDDPDAEAYLREEYLKLRLANADEEETPVPVTFRQEEAIERLAEASARVRLDDCVRREDIERALELVRTSMEQVGIDPETGEFDADVVETGQSKSQRDRRSELIAVMEDQDGISVEDLVDVVSWDAERVRADVDELKKEGRIYELGGLLRKA